MKIQFLGTGAADWGREFKGTPGYRRFSSCIVNDDLLIDPGPHIFDYTENVFDRAEQILMTHSHSDHLSPDTLRALGKRRERTLFGEKNGLSIANNIPGIRLSALPLFQEVVIGAYRVCALPANHGTEIPEEQEVHYTVSDGWRVKHTARRKKWKNGSKKAISAFAMTVKSFRFPKRRDSKGTERFRGFMQF